MSFKGVGAGQGTLRRKDVLTIAIPTVISIVLTCLGFLLIFTDKESAVQSPAPQLTLVSIAIATDGRILVNKKGVVPTQRVDLEGLPKWLVRDYLPFRGSK